MTWKIDPNELSYEITAKQHATAVSVTFEIYLLFFFPTEYLFCCINAGGYPKMSIVNSRTDLTRTKSQLADF